MYTVYAIYNKENDKFYIGQTKDLLSRLNLHNSKSFSGCYTSRFSGQWEVIYTETVENVAEALKREKQLKSYQGRQFIKKQIQDYLIKNL